MAKRKETLEIEEKLHYMCYKKRIYGCEEVTIGFYNTGHGNEIVDYCTMDSKGILRCYEIKVTLADLKSKAKKSWYGHYNYLVVTNELSQKIESELDNFIPEYVGVAVPCSASWSCGIQIIRNAKKQKLSCAQEKMLKESLIRSMYYKKEKYREASDTSVISKLKSELRRSEKERKKYFDESTNAMFVLNRFERALRIYYGKEIVLEKIIQEISHGNITLPESISLTLTERGEKYNQKVKELKEDEMS